MRSSTTLKRFKKISCVAGRKNSKGSTLQQNLLSQCERMKDEMAVKVSGRILLGIDLAKNIT